MTALPLETADPSSAAVTLDSYVPLLGVEIDELRALAKPLAGKEVTMVNSTRVGGGVAEVLNRIVPLLEELGLRPRWEVLDGDRDFFEVTNAFHKALHGSLAPLPAHAFDIFRSYNDYNRSRLHLDSEFMVMHDPQPAGLIDGRVEHAGHWIWRCHIDLSNPSPEVWNFWNRGWRATTLRSSRRRSFHASFPFRNICFIRPSIRCRTRIAIWIRYSCVPCWRVLGSIRSGPF